MLLLAAIVDFEAYTSSLPKYRTILTVRVQLDKGTDTLRLGPGDPAYAKNG